MINSLDGPCRKDAATVVARVAEIHERVKAPISAGDRAVGGTATVMELRAAKEEAEEDTQMTQRLERTTSKRRSLVNNTFSTSLLVHALSLHEMKSSDAVRPRIESCVESMV